MYYTTHKKQKIKDSEDVDPGGMQRKLEAYNHVLDQEMSSMRDGGKRRQQQFLIHCTYFSKKSIAAAKLAIIKNYKPECGLVLLLHVSTEMGAIA